MKQPLEVYVQELFGNCGNVYIDFMMLLLAGTKESKNFLTAVMLLFQKLIRQFFNGRMMIKELKAFWLVTCHVDDFLR